MAKVIKKVSYPEQEKLVSQIGEFMHYWGFKKIHGMIWSHIFLASDPIDAHTLIERLGVSKALISISIKDLLDYEVIREAGKSDKGTIVYEPNPNVIEVILNVLKKREKKMLTDIESSFKSFKDSINDEKKKASIHPKRMKMMGKMIREAQNTLTSMIILGEMNLSNWKEIDESENV